MPGFNPDKYLMEKAQAATPQGFDPDKYLQEKTSMPQASIEERAKVEEARKYNNPLKAAVYSAGNAGTLGYLPESEAGAMSLSDKIAQYVPGTAANILKNKQESGEFGHVPTFKENEVETRGEAKKLATNNPYSTLAGGIGGAVLQAPLMAAGLAKAGVTAGGGLIARGAKAAGIGAGLGLVQNPGEEGEKEDPLQIRERVHNAKIGGALGAAGEAAGTLASKGISAIKNLPETAKEMAANKAVKSAGGMLKDFRRLVGKNRTQELGEFAIDSGLVKTGSNFHTIADESKDALGKTGQAIGDIYEKIGSVAQDPTALGKKLSEAVIAKAPSIGKKAYTAQMEDVIDEIVTNPAVAEGNVSEINNIIGDLDTKINWGKKAQDLPENQAGYLALRNTLRNEVNRIAEETGNKGLVDLNKQFHNYKEINNMATDRVARETANNSFGLGDKIVGTGLGAAAAAGDDHDPLLLRLAKGGAIGLGGAIGSKFLRNYANPAITQGLLRGGQAAEHVVGNMRGLIPQSGPLAEAPGLLQSYLTDPRIQLLNAAKNAKDNSEKR